MEGQNVNKSGTITKTPVRVRRPPSGLLNCSQKDRNGNRNYASQIPRRLTRSMAILPSPSNTPDSPTDESRNSQCFLCNCVTHKSQRIKFRIQTPKVAENIMQASNCFQDSVFAHIAHSSSTEDMIKSKLFYHGDCLRLYMQKYKRHKESLDQQNNNESSPEQNQRPNNETRQTDSDLNDSGGESNISCNDIVTRRETLLRNVMEELIPRLRLMQLYTLSDIRDRVNCSLDPDTQMKNKDVRKFLDDNYSDRVDFYDPVEANKSTVIFDKTIPPAELLRRIHTTADSVKIAAEEIRKALFDTDFQLDDKFCDAHDIKDAWTQTEISQPLQHFFSHLFSVESKNFGSKSLIEDNEEAASDEEEDAEDEEDSVDFEGKLKRRSLTRKKELRLHGLFQMMYYNVFNGSKRTPLHLLTASAINATCKSASLIKSFNHLGVSISYDHFQRVQTQLANYAVENAGSSVPIPTNFDVNSFTTVAVDNFDHLGCAQFGVDSTIRYSLSRFSEEIRRYKEEAIRIRNDGRPKKTNFS